jgi:hypothetical protein
MLLCCNSVSIKILILLLLGFFKVKEIFLSLFNRIITYLRICREIYLNYGKYDYKLWLTVIAGSIIIQLVNIQNNGKRDYW